MKRLYLWCSSNIKWDFPIVKIIAEIEYTFAFYKQFIFDPRPENCLSFSKKYPQKIV